MEPRSAHFGCFELVKPNSSDRVFLAEFGSDGQPSRRRKEHTKSRSGCTNCKARKVKCDEAHPCGSCVKRKQTCRFITPQTPPCSRAEGHRDLKKLIRLSSIGPDRGLSPINMQHMRLLHHFHTFTSQTFIMHENLWKDLVLNLALEHPFLMHAVFLVTAKHLHHLQPSERRHEMLSLQSLSQTIPLFRSSLATTSGRSGNKCDALIACSMLLLQYSWTLNSSGWRCISGLYKGVRQTVLNFWDFGEESRLAPMLAYSPRLHLEQHLKDKATPADIEAMFSHFLRCSKISENSNGTSDDIVIPSQRLIAIMCSIRLGRPYLEKAGLMRAVARYLFSWPGLLPEGIVDLLRMRDTRAQVLMLYYFAIVSRLPSESFWWMRERAVFMCSGIFASLGERCEECTGPARKLLEEK